MKSRAGLRTGLYVFMGCAIAAGLARFSPIHRAGEGSPADYRVLYLPAARNLLDGRGFSDASGQCVTRVPPGYPLYVAACLYVGRLLGVGGDRFVAIGDIVCAGLIGCLLWWLGAQLWAARAAIQAVAAWALYPMALWLYSAPSTEAPYMVFLGLELVLALLSVRGARPKPWLAVLCGAAGGMGALVRPFAIGLPVVIAIWASGSFWPRGRRGALAMGLWMLAGYALAVAPWEAFAYARTGRVIPLSTAGAATMRDGLTFAVNLKSYRRGIHLPLGIEEVMARIRQATTNADPPARILGVLGEEYRRRPIDTTGLLLLKAARCFYGTDSHRHETAVLAIQTAVLLVLGLAWRRACRMGGDIRRVAWLVFWIGTYSLGVNLLGASLARYMIPAMLPAFLLLPALWRPGAQSPNSVEGVTGG